MIVHTIPAARVRYTFYAVRIHTLILPFLCMDVSIDFVDMTRTYSKVPSPSTQITKEAFDSGKLSAKYMYGCRKRISGLKNLHDHVL